MAAHSGVDMLCCDLKHYHETSVAFYIHCHTITCPVIRTDHLKHKFNGSVIYDQYFCRFAVSQRIDEYYCVGCRRIRYYVHCHCSSPGSLQCMSATAVLIDSLSHDNLRIYDDNCVPLPRICCNSWNCIPMKFMGGYRSNGKSHSFVFLVGIDVDLNKMVWPFETSFVSYKIHDTLIMLVVSCECSGEEGLCVRKIGENFNFMRLMVCCSYDRGNRDLGSDVLSGDM